MVKIVGEGTVVGEGTSSVDSILSQTGQDCEITLLVLVNLSIYGNRSRTN